jgi:uncharacterized repeat protein (TIGR01451 family)
MLLASQFVKRLLWKYILRGSLVAPILLAASLLAPSAQAVDLRMNGSRTVLSGTDCDIATYRFGTSNVFNGKNLDLLVEVLSEDNDNTAGPCIRTLPVTGNNIFTVDIRDRDETDTVAFMDLKFTVVERGTLIPVEVDRIAISGFDLDSNIDRNNLVYNTGTDDIYVQEPDGVYISSGSLVAYTEGTFFGGDFPTYQSKFKGRTTGNCNDGAGAAVDVTCRSGMIRINGTSGINKVSTFTLRVQNDDAYGRIPDTDTNALRRFQLSFEISELEELITNNTDYGDALASYGDARHSIGTNIALGYGLPPDHETATTLPSASANGDDNDGASSVKFDDEEGVSRGGVALDGQSLLIGSTTNLDITTFGTGFLSGWLDLNLDGDFSDPGEQVITNLSITSTGVLTTAVPISIPGTATAGASMMRFRFSTATGVTASGLSTTDGEVEDYQVALGSERSDAPTSYGEAIHNIVTGIRLGAAIDAETTSIANADASGDGADDDGISSFPELIAGATSYSIPAANITATGTGTLHAWIDFNKNGTFDIGEYINVAVTNNTPVGALTWTGITAGVAGNTFARFRFTSDTTVTASTPSGSAANGEVEDYQLAITEDNGVGARFLLVKRITAINGQATNPNDNTTQLDQVVDDTSSPQQADDNDLGWPAVFLKGALNGGLVAPDDTVEYTIYYLSAGSESANNVTLCDRIPSYQAFVPDAFNSLPVAPNNGTAEPLGDRGIEVSQGGINYGYTNIGDGDAARYYPPGSALPSACTQSALLEDNGTIVVNLGDVPNATAPGSPSKSYGFFRFRARVR